MTDTRHQLGDDVGGYILERHLGKGASATVYLARNASGEEVALKLLSPDIDLGERYHEGELPGRERLRAEAMALSKLDIPGVAQVLDLEIDSESEAFLVTEYIAGSTLEEDVRQAGLWLREDVLELGRLLANTLRVVHACGVCHRDIKPANVILGMNGPVLIDFGIAYATGAKHLTQTGLVVGTPGFISPEVICGNPPGYADDWWSLGATLLFALTGNPPFGMESQTVQIARVLAGNPDVEGLDPDLRQVFIRALAPEASRSADFSAILSALAVNPGLPPTRIQEYTERYNDDDNVTTVLPEWAGEPTTEKPDELRETVTLDVEILPRDDDETNDTAAPSIEADSGAEPSNPTPGILPIIGLSFLISGALLAVNQEPAVGLVAGVLLWFLATLGWYSRGKKRLFSAPKAFVKGFLSAIPGTLIVSFFLWGSYEMNHGLFAGFFPDESRSLDFFGISVPFVWALRAVLLGLGALVSWWLPSTAPARIGARGLLRAVFPRWWMRFMVGTAVLLIAIPTSILT